MSFKFYNNINFYLNSKQDTPANVATKLMSTIKASANCHNVNVCTTHAGSTARNVVHCTIKSLFERERRKRKIDVKNVSAMDILKNVDIRLTLIREV